MPKSSRKSFVQKLDVTVNALRCADVLLVTSVRYICALLGLLGRC